MSDVVMISKGGRPSFLVGVEDLFRGLRRTELWLAFAADEVQQRYRRSKVGLAWIIISYLMFVAGISIFFGGFSKKGVSDFVVYVAVNYALFSFLVANLTDGCAVFRNSKTWINSMPLPHSIYVLKSVSRGVFVCAISMTVALLVLASTGHLRQPVALLAVPAFILLLFNAVLVQTYLGYIAARYRDFEHFVQSVTRILFFATPIMWVLNEQPEGSIRRTIADLNPFTHALEIFSAPLLGHYPDTISWLVMITLTCVNLILMMVVSFLGHRRLPYWL